jgi:uncharacterized membrane protein
MPGFTLRAWTMTLLIAGLLLFLGLHSTRVVAEGWRTRFMAERGEKAWKGLYTVVSLASFAMLVWGYGLARQQPVVLWVPGAGLRHAALLLAMVSMVLLAAAYVPGNAIKARLHHPMILSVKVWALAHLLANGNLADLLLFGGFLLWAVAVFRAARRRDAAQGVVYPPGRTGPTLVALAAGLVGGAVFALWLHGPLIGVRPFA